MLEPHRPQDQTAPLLRDQERALKAYETVKPVRGSELEDFKNAVHALGAEILQSGLAAAMSGLERRPDKGMQLRKHLAKAGIPGLHQPSAPDSRAILRAPPDETNLPSKVRALPLDDYILATREVLQAVLWLKRAVQAAEVKGARPNSNAGADAEAPSNA